jgi:hypothetical protein
VEGSCEHGNEPSGWIKCWVILEWLCNWRLLKKIIIATESVTGKRQVVTSACVGLAAAI